MKCPELDIEEGRLEILWPIVGDGMCPDFGLAAKPNDLHGNIVANVAGGKLYGAAPNAKIVIVNKISPNFGEGIGHSYKAVLQHLKTLPKETYVIVNVSQGNLPLTVKPSLLSYNLIMDIIRDEHVPCFVSAAGNSSETGSTNITKDMRVQFIKDVEKWVNTKPTPAIVPPSIEKSIVKLPSGHLQVFSVGAFQGNDQLCTDFSYGSGVDIYGPGVDIPYFDSTGQLFDTFSDSNNLRKRLKGTSYASPLVAGTIACYMSMSKPVNRYQIKDNILKLARIIPGPGAQEKYAYICIGPL